MWSLPEGWDRLSAAEVEHGRNVAQAAAGGTANVYDYSQTITDQYLQQQPTYRPPIDLPPPAAYFTDRVDLLATLTADLQPGRVITLCGPGGIGKTALAAQAVLELAHEEELVRRFPDGVLFHSFYQEPASDQAFQYVAAMYGETETPVPTLAARRALAGRAALLVLDGAEDAQDLAAVLAIRGRCGVLITTRQRADAPADLLDVTPLALADAVTLLQQWAGDQLGDDADAARICELVGELPLAVRLAGSALRVDGLTAGQFLEHFLEQTPLASLHRGQRQRESVPLLLERSVALAAASATARQALAVTGILAFAPFDAAMIAAALDQALPATLTALGHLVRNSLLTSQDGGYVVAHRLVHTYARRRIAVEPDIYHRLTDHLAGLFATTPERAQLEGLRPHLLALLELAQTHRAWDDVARLAGAIDEYLDLQGLYVDRRTVIDAGLTAARASRNMHSLGVRLMPWEWRVAELGYLEDAIGYHQQALAISQEAGDRAMKGKENSLRHLGVACAEQGHLELAMDYYEQCVGYLRQSPTGNGGATLNPLARGVDAEFGRLEEPSTNSNRR